MRHRPGQIFLIAGLVLAVPLVAASPARSEEDGCQPNHSRNGWGKSIRLLHSNAAEARLVTKAIKLWQACPGYGRDFPFFVLDDGGFRTVEVVLSTEIGANGTCAHFHRDRIVLYSETVDSTGKRLHCGDLSQNLAHELGHVLGLAHVERRDCAAQIMGMVDRKSTKPREVSSAECAAAGAAWLTSVEFDRALELGWIRADGFGPPRREIDARLRALDALEGGTAVNDPDQ